MHSTILRLVAAVDLSPLPHASNQNSFIATVISIVVNIVGALCLLMITIGGFRYVLSQGDPQGIKKAKGTILYALIGLVVVIAAKTIVAFIVKKTQ